MALRSLTTVPPGGWRLTQTLPDGSTKAFASMGLVWEFAEQIADFRKGNGLAHATPKEVVHEIEAQTCARLHGDREWCVDSEKKSSRPAAVPQSRSAKLAAGARVIVEWLGEGAKPVPIRVAQARSDVCLTCPENREGHAFLKLTSDTVRAIAEQMQQKDRMKLRVNGEDKLHACAICACPLPLKVHVPLPTILAHTDAETLAAFPSYCWLTTERQRL